MAKPSSLCADILNFPLLLSLFSSDVPPDCSLPAEGPPRIECWQGALGEQQLPGWPEGGAGGKVCGGNRGGLEGRTPPAGSDEVREGQRAQPMQGWCMCCVRVLHALSHCIVVHPSSPVTSLFPPSSTLSGVDLSTSTPAAASPSRHVATQLAAQAARVLQHAGNGEVVFEGAPWNNSTVDLIRVARVRGV